MDFLVAFGQIKSARYDNAPEVSALGEAVPSCLPEVPSAITHKLHLALFKPAGRGGRDIKSPRFVLMAATHLETVPARSFARCARIMRYVRS